MCMVSWSFCIFEKNIWVMIITSIFHLTRFYNVFRSSDVGAKSRHDLTGFGNKLFKTCRARFIWHSTYHCILFILGCWQWTSICLAGYRKHKNLAQVPLLKMKSKANEDSFWNQPVDFLHSIFQKWHKNVFSAVCLLLIANI